MIGSILAGKFRKRAGDAIRNVLLAHFRTLPKPMPRVACEYGADLMKNIDFAPDHETHPVDLAVLHPLTPADAPNSYSGYAWAAQNAAVLGLIEVKKNWLRAMSDVHWLEKVSGLPALGTRKLEWVMLVVFLAVGLQKL